MPNTRILSVVSLSFYMCRMLRLRKLQKKMRPTPLLTPYSFTGLQWDLTFITLLFYCNEKREERLFWKKCQSELRHESLTVATRLPHAFSHGPTNIKIWSSHIDEPEIPQNPKIPLKSPWSFPWIVEVPATGTIARTWRHFSKNF